MAAQRHRHSNSSDDWPRNANLRCRFVRCAPSSIVACASHRPIQVRLLRISRRCCPSRRIHDATLQQVDARKPEQGAEEREQAQHTVSDQHVASRQSDHAETEHASSVSDSAASDATAADADRRSALRLLSVARRCTIDAGGRMNHG